MTLALDCPEFEDQHCNRVCTALAFACEIEDFDDFVDPRRLFNCCLGLESSKYVLEKILREEKNSKKRKLGEEKGETAALPSIQIALSSLTLSLEDEEIQAALLRTDTEKDKVVQKFMQSKQFSDLQLIQYFKSFELLRRWMMKHHNLVVDFSNLDFEKIDNEILIDEAKEQEETEADAAVEKDSAGKDTIGGKDTDESTVPPS
nr:hypothetical protein CFP56_18074 [Quercus suber]